MSYDCTAEGCAVCCAGKREHAQFWCPGIGFHGYVAPDRELILERMRRRYGIARD